MRNICDNFDNLSLDDMLVDLLVGFAIATKLVCFMLDKSKVEFELRGEVANSIEACFEIAIK